MQSSKALVVPSPDSLRKTRYIAAVVCCLFSILAGTSQAQTFTSLANFFFTDGQGPQVTFVQGVDGNFYTTTPGGGTGEGGTVVKLTPSGTLTVIHDFCLEANCPDGEESIAALVLDADGILYGTTNGGGSFFNGTAFSISDLGVFKTLNSFNYSDGGDPSAMVQGRGGNFYGVTTFGGANSVGLVFKLTPGGGVTTVYSFCAQTNCTDGFYPQWIMLGQDGNLYGTTEGGGSHGVGGTVFKLTPTGTLKTLYSFCAKTNCADGSEPVSVVQGADGNFYGLTPSGGNQNDGGGNGNGTVFKVTPAGTLTTLYNFCRKTNCTDGAFPMGALIQATDGNLYGTTYNGGTHSHGTIFKITTRGVFTVLHNFCQVGTNCTDGSSPAGGLFQATDGNFYGTAVGGGICCGTAFKLSMGLHSFAQAIPGSGAVGTKVTLLGTDLSGATAVSFNGVEATFSVVSRTEIRATVPSKATSGEIKVTTPLGTLVSNLSFQITK